jgi:hypothetical protein
VFRRDASDADVATQADGAPGGLWARRNNNKAGYPTLIAGPWLIDPPLVRLPLWRPAAGDRVADPGEEWADE